MNSTQKLSASTDSNEIQRPRMAKQGFKFAGTLAFLLAAGFVLSNLSQVNAESEESLSKKGLRIAPVPLNLQGKNVELVGYGSYLVNAVADCNGCHTSGPDAEYTFGGIPYFAQKPTKVNPDTYLGGGSDFGQLIPDSAEIVSRNLTPDKTGRPAGGISFDDFLNIIRTGVDLDKAHPTCTGAPNAGCVPPPFDGSLLQVMPWPTFANMTDHDLRAIYEYLSSVPCISGPPAPDIRHNECK